MKTSKWIKIKDSQQMIVWKNIDRNQRVIVRKGAKTWQTWIEKTKGRIASDESFISNGFIATGATKLKAIKAAKEYMTVRI